MLLYQTRILHIKDWIISVCVMSHNTLRPCWLILCSPHDFLHLASSPHGSWPSRPHSPCMESISAIHFLIWSFFLYLFPFAFMSLCDLSIYNSVAVMSSHPPCPCISALIPVSICATLVFPTHIYKPHMSCMSQFIYQLQLNFYCQSPTSCQLKSHNLSIFSSLQKLFDSWTSAF